MMARYESSQLGQLYTLNSASNIEHEATCAHNVNDHASNKSDARLREV